MQARIEGQRVADGRFFCDVVVEASSGREIKRVVRGTPLADAADVQAAVDGWKADLLAECAALPDLDPLTIS